MKSLWKMTWMEAKLFLREPIAAFFTLVFPLMMLFIFGIIASDESAQIFNGKGTMDVAIPSLTAVIIAIMGLMATTMTMATYRENGILRRLRTTPISPFVVLAAQVIVDFTMTFLGMVVLIVVGSLVYHIHFEGDPISMLAGFILCSLSFFGIGFILAGALPSARTAWVTGMVLMYPMMYFSGAFFPLDKLSPTVQMVSKFMPLTYVVNLLRGLWFGDSLGDHLLDVGILSVVLLLSIIISVETFRWE